MTTTPEVPPQPVTSDSAKYARLYGLVTLDDLHSMCGNCQECGEASAVEQTPTRCRRHNEIGKLLQLVAETRIE